MPSFTSWGTFKGLLVIISLALIILYIFGSTPETTNFSVRHRHSPIFRALQSRNRTYSSSPLPKHVTEGKTADSKHNTTNSIHSISSGGQSIIDGKHSTTAGKHSTINGKHSATAAKHNIINGTGKHDSVREEEYVLPKYYDSTTKIAQKNATDSSNSNLVHMSATNSTISKVISSNLISSSGGNNNKNYDVSIETTTGANVTGLPLCPDDINNELCGRVPIVLDPVPTIAELEKEFHWLKPGGHWQPENCRVLKKVALIIPFRCRGKHLLLFLKHMHPFLKKQMLDYTIFIIEQEGNGPFNRAMLMNIGFKEALKQRNFDCFIFHDIDLLPENDRNIYSCPLQPRHMSVAVDIFHYKLPYTSIFGGVSAITKEHFELLNGFSNSFWGWGGEDDDMANRIKYHNLYVSRYPPTIARYTMLEHKKDTPSPNRYDMLAKGIKMYDKDGLNSLKYEVVQKKQNLLYTWVLVKIHPPS